MLEKRNVWLPVLLMVVFAITRWPRLMPPNFSAVYALVFCAGVYFRDRLGWWVPLVIMALTDVAINCYYTFFAEPQVNAFQWYQLMNYPAYAAIFWLGRRFQPQSRFAALLGGGLLGAILFYVITNTGAWFFNPFGNPEYTKTITSWFLALTKGAANWPQTWEFFRNTLFSAGLFTGLFVGAMKYSEHFESAAEKQAANATNATEDTEGSETEAQPDKA